MPREVRFTPVIADVPRARVRGARMLEVPARRNVPATAAARRRGPRGGIVKPKGRFEHLRVRPPEHFEKTPSLKTIPWGFVAPEAERRFVLRKLGLRSLPPGTKAVTGRIKGTVTTGRVPGVRVKYLAQGVQGILIPIRGGKRPARPRGTPVPKRATARKVVARAARPNARRRGVRCNPGQLMILANPLPPKLMRFAQRLSPSARVRFMKAVHRYKKFHGVWPKKITKVGSNPGSSPAFLVGMGRTEDVSYSANKGYRGSSKKGIPWRHRFRSKPVMATTETGKQIVILNRPGASREFGVTDFIRG